MNGGSSGVFAALADTEVSVSAQIQARTVFMARTS